MKKFACGCIILMTSLFSFSQNYKKLHERSILVDTHNDILTTAVDKNLSIDQDLSGKTYSDLKRFKEGGVDVQIFSIWCDGDKKNPYAWANREMDTLDAVIARNPGSIELTGSSDAMLHAVKKHRLAAMYGVEGGHMIENDLNKLDSFYKRGARYMTLTWNNSTDWATSAFDESTRGDSLPHKGLTAFGKEVVKRMNSLGMLVDLSHVGEQTFWDAINTTTKPVIVSHSCAYTLCPFRRNLKDAQILAVGKNGGVIHLNFYSGFLDSTYMPRKSNFVKSHQTEVDSLRSLKWNQSDIEEFLLGKYHSEAEALRPPLSLLLDHLDYIVKLIGVDHVGLGSDFDGIESAPKELNSVADYPLITKALLERGYKKEDIRKILGGNFIRLFENR